MTGIGSKHRYTTEASRCRKGNEVRSLSILDTHTCIAILRGNDAVIEKRRQTPERVVTTWITAGELFYGAAKSRDPVGNKSLVERFLDTLPVLAFDSITAQFF